MIGFVSDSRLSVTKASNEFLKIFVATAKEEFGELPLRILGPSPASVAKISNKYRYKIIIKCRNNKEFRKLLSEVLLDFSSNKEYKNVSAYVDMNALSF
jgi:primosomal protein N' (replication factor Y)